MLKSELELRWNLRTKFNTERLEYERNIPPGVDKESGWTAVEYVCAGYLGDSR